MLSNYSGSEPRPTGLGLLHCTLQHFPVRKRLRVSILKIEVERNKRFAFGLAINASAMEGLQVPFCKPIKIFLFVHLKVADGMGMLRAKSG
ncbi:unnamed protein product [Cylicostephanus goldi]|uniref:Uncharacterized protein n=1 Tax=Cylicostephanus goldi TaxID=71465 RepID=A0A3P6RII8_CYLGO|nr:unnamed protein product [Cylicostephanus goldi]